MSYEVTPLPYIRCAYESCLVGATVRVRKRQGWAQLCPAHYASDNVQESKDYCLHNALISTEEKIEHCRTLFKAPRDPRAWLKNPRSEIARQYADEVLHRQGVTREPGQDDEEREAA